MSLAGKLAVVTGAASGIGKRTARAFASAGADLALVDTDEAGLEKLTAELETAGTRVSAHTADLSQVDQILELFGVVLATLGRFDALANIAAILPIKPTLEIT